MLRSVNWLRTVNWLTRALGFAWLGVLAFVLAPPPGGAALVVQVVGYSLLGAALAAVTATTSASHEPGLPWARGRPGPPPVPVRRWRDNEGRG
jgi:hypothetical protein